MLWSISNDCEAHPDDHVFHICISKLGTKPFLSLYTDTSHLKPTSDGLIYFKLATSDDILEKHSMISLNLTLMSTIPCFIVVIGINSRYQQLSVSWYTIPLGTCEEG